MARINRQLNLVTTIDGENGAPIYVHSTPFSREVFEMYFLPMSRAFAAMHSNGIALIGGPKVAALMVKQAAIELNMWEGPGNVQEGFFNEIKRLTNVVVSTPDGWETLPWSAATGRELLSEGDQEEILAAITFFILASALHTRTVLPGALDTMCKLYGQAVTSLNVTEYKDSLPIWKPEQTTNESPPAAVSVVS